MFRHPKYLEIPWEMHWHREQTEPESRYWLIMILLILSAVFLIGVGVTSGMVS